MHCRNSDLINAMGRIILVCRYILLIAVPVFLFSCKKDQVTQPQVLISTYSGLSITNAAIGINNLHFFVDNQQVLLPDTLSYGNTEFFTIQNYVYSNVTPYKDISYGYRQLGFIMPGGDNFLVSFNNYFQSGAKYSIFIADTISHGQLKYVLLKDEIGISDSTKTQIRFINLSPDAPAMDVWVFPNAGTYGYKLFSNRPYPVFDYSSIPGSQVFTKLDAGPYYFVATAAGTYNVLLQGGLILPGRGVITIYAKGLLSGTGNNQLDVGVIEFVQ
jgi:hypothetical protein